MDLLKAKQIKTLQERAENAFSSSSASNSDEDEHTKARPAQRRTSAASEERWAATISSTPIGSSIWGSIPDQERGRASRSASFSVGQEFVSSPFGAHVGGQPAGGGMTAAEARKMSSADDQTRLLREQLQQMKFKSRSKSSYAAAWHVPDLDDYDANSDDVFLDEDDLVSRMRRGESPGLRYTTPTNPRLGSLRGDQQRRASFNNTSVRPHELERPSRSPLSHESLRHHGGAISGLHDPSSPAGLGVGGSGPAGSGSTGIRLDGASRLEGPPTGYSGMMADVDRYFSSDDHRTRTKAALAQSVAQEQQADGQQFDMSRDYSGPGPAIRRQQQPAAPLYIVEFKACRTDVFHAADASLQLRVGDLVLVEADRGRDLGKLVRENVTQAQFRALKAQQARDQAVALGTADVDTVHYDLDSSAANMQPKLIYRHAQEQEIAMLMVKSQDEQQAMLVCQAKVRQRKLSMEVLDAEYQWDRRKLTFYYYATQRIDFRELVRDLFKIYKTRIWMCACNPTSVEGSAPGIIGESKSQDVEESVGTSTQQQQQPQHVGPSSHHFVGARGGRPPSYAASGTYSPSAAVFNPAMQAYGYGASSPATPHTLSPAAGASPSYYNAYVDSRGHQGQPAQQHSAHQATFAHHPHHLHQSPQHHAIGYGQGLAGIGYDQSSLMFPQPIGVGAGAYTMQPSFGAYPPPPHVAALQSLPPQSTLRRTPSSSTPAAEGAPPTRKASSQSSPRPALPLPGGQKEDRPVSHTSGAGNDGASAAAEKAKGRGGGSAGIQFGNFDDADG